MNNYIKKQEDKKLKKLKSENLEEYKKQKELIEKSRKKQKDKSKKKIFVFVFGLIIVIVLTILNSFLSQL